MDLSTAGNAPFSFVAEGKRLGIEPPYIGQSRRGSETYYADGLCITGCFQCRDFRNEVRESLAMEAAFAELDAMPKPADVEWDSGYSAGYRNGVRDTLNALVGAAQETLDALNA